MRRKSPVFTPVLSSTQGARSGNNQDDTLKYDTRSILKKDSKAISLTKFKATPSPKNLGKLSKILAKD